jgi:hypothetical protein
VNSAEVSKATLDAEVSTATLDQAVLSIFPRALPSAEVAVVFLPPVPPILPLGFQAAGHDA